MFWPDRGSGVPVEPARRPVASAVRQYFTEGGAGQAPTVPGGDWFNQITNELLNVLAAAGIDPSKADDDQLLEAIQTIIATAESSLRAELSSESGAELIGTKYGTLNVFTDKVAFAPSAGILTTNTPVQNTAALNALRTIGGISLYMPAGTFPFDVFASTGLAEVVGAGKDLTIVTLTGTTSPVMVQPGPIVHRNIWFKSVAGSLEWSRIGMADYAVFEKCKVSDFIHTSSAPNAWGCYFKNAKGCRLYHVEFDNNSQSDIPVLEGTTDLIIEGCYSTSGNLVINFEPNTGSPSMSGIALRNMAISKLFLQNNDLTSSPDNLVRIDGCVINELYYDGLGASFSESKINSFVNVVDNLSRAYGASITGLLVGDRELIPDPMLSNVGHTGSGCPWSLRFSTAQPIDRYNRAPTGEIVIGVNGVAASTSLSTGNLPCKPNTPYLFTICKEVVVGGTRPNIVSVGFKDSGGTLIGTETYLARNLSGTGHDRHQHILVSPSGAVFIELTVFGGDTATTYQSVAYRYVSMREIELKRTGVDSASIGYSAFPSRVKLPITKAQFDANQYYLAPLPAGTEVEFSYAAASARLSKVTAQAANNTGKIGTLQLFSNYP
ncbi:hypothetical protein K3H43_01320 [Aeromonas veronii]|uniref:hypothetical protein n=1 Tax=Aeromonas veronii TaxID=654 RepID=UPI001F21E4C5|nr:hypothetical protein [Aeromonas veronii]MCF5726029.1 hypothetical protein [Aeromonas veronii]